MSSPESGKHHRRKFRGHSFTSVVFNVICKLAQIHTGTQIRLRPSCELTNIVTDADLNQHGTWKFSHAWNLRCYTSNQLGLPNDPQPNLKTLDLNTSFGALEFRQESANMTLYSLKSTSSKYSRHSWWHCGRDNRWLVPPTYSRSSLVGKLLKPCQLK